MAWEEREKREKEKQKNKTQRKGKRERERERTLENEGMQVLAWLGLIGYRDFRSEKIEWFC